MDFPDDEDDEDDEDFVVQGGVAPHSAPSLAEPSWAKKLKEKMKKLFCLQAKGQYRAHVAEKEARRRHKALGRHVGLEVRSGSKEYITDEEVWISRHCKWGSEDDLPGSSAPSPPGTVSHTPESGEY